MSDEIFTWPIRVYYEDTDLAGIVYHGNYLKFFERARSEWLRALEIEQTSLLNDEQVVFVVRKATLDYLKPAYYNDMLTATATISHLGNARVQFTQALINQHNVTIATAVVDVVCIDANTFQAKRLPDVLRDAFKQQ